MINETATAALIQCIRAAERLAHVPYPYAVAISGWNVDGGIDWRAVHAVVVERWSAKALERIKDAALGHHRIAGELRRVDADGGRGAEGENSEGSNPAWK